MTVKRLRRNIASDWSGKSDVVFVWHADTVQIDGKPITGPADFGFRQVVRRERSRSNLCVGKRPECLMTMILIGSASVIVLIAGFLVFLGHEIVKAEQERYRLMNNRAAHDPKARL